MLVSAPPILRRTCDWPTVRERSVNSPTWFKSLFVRLPWGYQDLNLGPLRYQRSALTT